MSSKTLWVAGNSQQNGYYCGPATAQIIFDYHGISKTQDECAALLGTTSSGTAWYSNSQWPTSWPMFEVLCMSGKSYYCHPGSSMGGSLTQSALLTLIVNSINAGKPLAMNYVGSLNGYTTPGHWLVIRGYSSNGDTVQLVDPFYGHGATHLAFDAPLSTIFGLVSTRGVVSG